MKTGLFPSRDSLRPHIPGLLCWLLPLLLAFPANAADFLSKNDPSKPQQPTLLQADRLLYNEKKGTVTAKGNVEVAQGNQVLHADRIVYNQKKGTVRATGHVSVLQPSGDIIFADKVELTTDMKQGFVENVGVLFLDKSRMAARDAQRYEGRYLVADLGVYTACNLCEDDPSKPPLWQMKGVRITHDNEAKDVIYRDATIEFGGIPLFYMPYFSHPDPTVKRRQGLLTISGGYTQNIGAYARVPYYFDLAPNSDLVVSPVFSAKDKAQLGGEWRHRFADGAMRWSGSFTRTDVVNEYGDDEGRQWRGHLFGDAIFDIDNEWRAGTDVAFTSDKSYLRRYNISTEDVLVNRAFLEGFRGRHYAAANTYYFQDLRPGSQMTEPFVAPALRLNALGEPGRTLGGRWSLDGSLMVTTRDRDGVKPSLQGPDTRRLAAAAGWERQLVSSTGFLTNFSALARMDGYWADNVPETNTENSALVFSDIFKIRQFAQGNASVRYPFGRHGGSYQQILEPIAVVSAAPQLSNQSLPNEDSLDVEFDETNLFLPNRFTGIDRLEGGIRAAYGLRHALVGDSGARIEMLGGQVYRLERDENFPEDSGLQKQLSDFVGRLDFTPAEWFDLNYGFRYDHDKKKFQRQEMRSSAGVSLFRPFANYLAVRQTPASGVRENVEELTFGATSHFAKYYSLSAAHKRALQPDPGPRVTSIGLNYMDECFTFGIRGQRIHTDRQDVTSGDSVMFHFYLKNIGGLSSISLDPSLMETPENAR